MESQDMLAGFNEWLKGLAGGETTFYGAILTGILIPILIWLFRRLLKRRISSPSNSKNEADKKNKDFPEVANIDVK